MNFKSIIARLPEGPLANGRGSQTADHAPVSLQGLASAVWTAGFGALFAALGLLMSGVSANFGGMAVSSGSPPVLLGAGLPG